MANVDQIISSINRKKLTGEKIYDTNFTCSCTRNKPCPQGGKYNVSDLVYEANVEEPNTGTEHSYIGMTSEAFRNRYAKHKQSFNNENYKNQTTLSRKVWELKENGQVPEVKFKISKLSKSYRAGDKYCLLCTDEKIEIINNKSENQLNSRIEIFARCRHRSRIKINTIK